MTVEVTWVRRAGLSIVMMKHPERFRADLATLFGMLAEVRITPVLAARLPLETARAARGRIEAGKLGGKLVVRVSAP